MIVTTNNPIKEIINICNDLYPLKHCASTFVQGLKQKEDAWAVTGWSDNEDIPEIFVDVSAPYSECVELIAHEFAHVVVGEGEGNGHGEEWEKVLSEINIAFNDAQDG